MVLVLVYPGSNNTDQLLTMADSYNNSACQSILNVGKQSYNGDSVHLPITLWTVACDSGAHLWIDIARRIIRYHPIGAMRHCQSTRTTDRLTSIGRSLTAVSIGTRFDRFTKLARLGHSTAWWIMGLALSRTHYRAATARLAAATAAFTAHTNSLHTALSA